MHDQYTAILRTLEQSQRVLITTHVRPDGDALGSSAAMYLALKHKGIAADVLLLSHLPSKYGFVYAEAGVPHIDVEKSFPADFSLDAYDTLLVVDTGTWSQLPGMREYVEKFKGRKLVVDHHVTQEDWADHKLVITAAGAAGEVVAELIEQWGIPVSAPMATALYVAIVSDTGWFQYSNTRPYTLRLAAELVEAGVDTDRIYQLLFQNERAERIALHARGLRSLQLLADNRLAVMALSRSDFTETKAKTTDSENLINFPLQVRTVEASVLLTDPPEGGPVRISFRSKGQLDVAAFAQLFAGGGHVRAAGAKIEGTLEDVTAKVVAKLLEKMA